MAGKKASSGPLAVLPHYFRELYCFIQSCGENGFCSGDYLKKENGKFVIKLRQELSENFPSNIATKNSLISLTSQLKKVHENLLLERRFDNRLYLTVNPGIKVEFLDPNLTQKQRSKLGAQAKLAGSPGKRQTRSHGAQLLRAIYRKGKGFVISFSEEKLSPDGGIEKLAGWTIVVGKQKNDQN